MKPFQPKLSGVEIANVRIAASKSSAPTIKRAKRFYAKPSHVWKKQLAKIAARSE